MPHQDEHSWFRSRLAAFVAGLLEELDEKRFREHLSSCMQCREALYVYGRGEDNYEIGTGHIPSALIAQWDSTRRTLRGLERFLIRRHLDRCLECRQDLELLGFQPMLEHVPELELAPELEEEFFDKAEIGTTHSPESDAMGDEKGYAINVVKQLTPAKRPWWAGWALGSWAVAASVTIVILLFFFRPQFPMDNDLRPGGLTVPWVAPALVRGDETGSILDIAPGTRTIVVVVRVPRGIPSDSKSSIEVFSPNNRLLSRTPLQNEELQREFVLTVLNSPEPLESGRYRVLFLKGAPSDPSNIVTETWFEIRLIKS